MIKTILSLYFVITLVFCAEPTLLHNGEFQTHSLKDNTYAPFEVYVRGGHRGIFIQASPYGCDAPLELFAGNKPNPTEEQHQWRSEHERISHPTFLFVEETQHTNATLYINIRSKGTGTHCLFHIVAHIRHLQTLLQLTEGVPAYGVFLPRRHEQELLNNYNQFKLGRGVTIKFEDLSFVATNLEGRRDRQDVVLENFAATTTSRPLPGKHEWSGLTSVSGDSFLRINSKDPKFKPNGTYYVSTHLAGPQEVRQEERIYYSIVAHTLTQTTNATLDPPVLLLADQIQAGFAPGNHYSYYTLYVDAARANRDVHVVVRAEFGGVKAWASTKTTKPSAKDHQWAGKDVKQNEVEITINVEEPSFVFVGVWADPNLELLSTFDVIYRRGE